MFVLVFFQETGHEVLRLLLTGLQFSIESAFAMTKIGAKARPDIARITVAE